MREGSKYENASIEYMYLWDASDNIQASCVKPLTKDFVMTRPKRLYTQSAQGFVMVISSLTLCIKRGGV